MNNQTSPEMLVRVGSMSRTKSRAPVEAELFLLTSLLIERFDRWSVSVTASRVENRRSGFSLPVAVGVLSRDPPQSGLA